MMSKSVAIIGAGVSGYGAAILAKKKGYDVFVSDRNKISNDFKKIFLQNNRSILIKISSISKRHLSLIMLAKNPLIFRFKAITLRF